MASVIAKTTLSLCPSSVSRALSADALCPRPHCPPSSLEPASDLALCCCCSVTQSCPTLCDPRDCSLPGSSVRGISRQEHWNGLPFPSPGDLSYPRIKHISPALAGRFFTTEPLGKPHLGCSCCCCCCSVAKMCLTLCNTMVCSVPGFPVLHYFTEFAQTYVH